MIKLSPRLQIIYDMVPKCTCIADVGCDHGYLTIALLQSDRADRAIALDVNKGPLDTAKANIVKAGLYPQTQLRLSDGLDKLSEAEADVICICGMGGALITRILEKNLSVAQSVNTLIVEPQSEFRVLREFLQNNHFCIQDEALCQEEGKFYPIIKASFNNSAEIKLSEPELEYGPIIIKNKPPLFKELLEKNKGEYQSILNKLNQNVITDKDSPIQKRKEELTEKLSIISTLELEMEVSYGNSNY